MVRRGGVESRPEFEEEKAREQLYIFFAGLKGVGWRKAAWIIDTRLRHLWSIPDQESGGYRLKGIRNVIGKAGIVGETVLEFFPAEKHVLIHSETLVQALGAPPESFSGVSFPVSEVKLGEEDTVRFISENGSELSIHSDGSVFVEVH